MHVLRNSLIPVVTYLAVDFGVAAWSARPSPRASSTSPASATPCSRRSSATRDPTVVSFVTVMVLIYLVVNLLVDLLYGVLDPRIRYVK